MENKEQKPTRGKPQFHSLLEAIANAGASQFWAAQMHKAILEYKALSTWMVAHTKDGDFNNQQLAVIQGSRWFCEVLIDQGKKPAAPVPLSIQGVILDAVIKANDAIRYVQARKTGGGSPHLN